MAIEREQIDRFVQHLHETHLLEGVDRRLRLELVLSQLGVPDDAAALRAQLSPVVARSREEQARFAELFDAHFEPSSAAAPTGAMHSWSGNYLPPMPPPPPPWWTKRRVAGAIVATVVVLFAIAAYIGSTMPPETDAARAGNTTPPAGTESVTVTFNPPRSSADTLLDASRGVPANRVEPAAIDWRVGTSATAVLLAAIALLVRSMLSTRRRRRMTRAADARRRATPPFVWTPKPAQPRLFVSSEFFDAARIAQRRQSAPGSRVSIERSVSATIASAGMPSIRFERASRPPEYLLLIERLGPGDHQALLFDALVQRLGQEGIYIERFFFERDPRICVAERYGRMTLAELEHRFRDHRLVILGAGDGLLDDDVVALAPWATVFEEWTDRAILTPVPMASWGAREDALASLFAVLPASAVGLRAIVEGFELESTPDMRWWRESYGADRPLPRDPAADLPGLRAALGETVWRWLCACAVYPDLHWALTLYLGGLPTLGGGATLSEERLLRLASLPWFREGFIPPALRVRLLDGLGRRTERVVREAILAVLGVAPPEPESAAGRWHAAQMLVQRVLLQPDDPSTRAELQRQLQELPRSLLVRDPAARRRLRDIRASRIERLLPRAMRRVLFRDGIALFGTRPWAKRSAGAAALVAVVALPGLLPDGPRPPMDAADAWFVTATQVRMVPGDTITLYAIFRTRDDTGIAGPRRSAPFGPQVVRKDATGRLLPETPAAPVRWSAPASSVATVDSAGHVRALARGTVALRVDAGGRTTTVPLTVSDSLPGGLRAVVDVPGKTLAVGDVRSLTEPLGAPAQFELDLAVCDPLIANLGDSLNVHGLRAGTTAIVFQNATHAEVRPLSVTDAPPPDGVVLRRPVEFDPVTGALTAQARRDLAEKGRLLAADRTIRLSPSVTTRGDSVNGGGIPASRSAASAMRRLLLQAGANDTQVTRISAAAFRGTGPTISGVALCGRPRLGYIDFAWSRDTAIAAATTPRPQPPIRLRPPPPSPSQRTTAPPSTGIGTAAPNAARAARLDTMTKAALPAQRADTSAVAEPAVYARARQQIRRQQNLVPASEAAKRAGAGTAYPAFGTMPDSSYAFIELADLGTSEGSVNAGAPIYDAPRLPSDFELHRTGGIAYVVGFVPPSTARALLSGSDVFAATMYARGTERAPCAVAIPLSRTMSIRTVSRADGAIEVTDALSGSAPRAIVDPRTSICGAGAQSK